MPQAAAAAVFQIAGWVATNLGASSVTALKVASVAVKVSATVAKVALLAGANAVIANQNKPRPQGGMINLTLSPNEPRRLQIGQRIHAGVLADWYVTAARNSHLFLIVYLGEGPMGALKKVYAGGRVVYSTPIAHGVRTAIPDFRSGGDRLWITYYDGRPGQTADSTLVGRSVGWTSNHVGTGCAYAIIEAHWDSDVLTSPPAFSFETEGAKLYDRRKDTTAGGSGSHRLDDPSTWEVSANPAVALDHFLLGRYLGSIKTFGIGLDPDEVPYAKFAALANLCDEDVDLSSSGTQKRYEANGFLFADRSYADTIRDLCRAMNARPADFGGQVGIIDGEEKTPVLTLYDADLIENIPEQYAPKRSWGELVNTVLGTYQNPAQLYQATEYPRITDAAWVTEDGGSVKEDNLDLEMEVSAERAQRLAWLHAKRQRRQATLVGAYKLRAIELEQGDWFIRSGSVFGEEGKVFEVIDRILDPATFAVTINAFEVDPADTAWATDIPSAAPVDPTPDDGALVAMEVPDLTVTAETLTGTAAQLPAIVVEWAAPDDPRVRQIMVEAVPEAGGVPMSAVAEVGTTQIVFTNGITDDTDYLVRARFLGVFSPSEWTSNFEVTTEGDYSVGAATTVPWSGVTGTGRPADNATVGAVAGTNLYRTDGTTVLTQGDVRTVEGTAAAITGQGPGATAAAADVLNDALRTGTLFNAALPIRPAIAADFTGSIGSGTPSSIAALTGGTVVNVANEGDVMQFASNTALSHRGWLPIVSSQTYRIRARVRVTADGTLNQLVLQFVSYNAAGTVLSAHSATAIETDFVAADGWIEREIVITGAAILAAQPTAAFLRARVYGGRNTSGAYSGATWQVAWIRLADATDDMTARAQIVDSFVRDGYHWTTAFGGAPGSQLDPADATYQDVANVGRTIRISNLPKYLQPKGAIRPAIGRRYLVIADVAVTTDATGGTLRAQLYVNGLSSGFAHGAASWTSAAPSGMISDKNPIAAADGEVRLAAVFTCTALGTYDAYWRPRVDLTRPSGTGGVIEVRRFRIIDVTDSVVGRLISGLLRDDGTTAITEAAVITALGTAGAIAGQGNLATSNLNRGTTASRPTATGSGSLYANATTGTVQMDTAAGVWTDIATLSTAVQPRGRILGPAAVNVSNTSTWNVVAQVDLTDIPASAVIQAPYVDAVGQSQDGISIGAGWQWRLCEAPTSSPSTKTVLKSGNISLTAGAPLGGGAYDPPTVDSIDQPSAALVAATNSGAVRYTIEVQRTSGSAVVGIQMTANFIINPS